MKTDLFQSCGHCWVFQICWHIECSTLTASSFRIWNSSAGIPSLSLALFIVMLPKAHLFEYPNPSYISLDKIYSRRCTKLQRTEYMLVGSQRSLLQSINQKTSFLKNFLFCIGVQPINNVMIVSGVQQRDSAIHIHISVLPQNCPPILAAIEQSSLCYTVGPCRKHLNFFLPLAL